MARSKLVPDFQGASTAEAKRVHNLVRRHTLPVGMRDFVVRFGEDADGERAVWISFIVPRDYQDSNEKISAANDFVREVRSDLLRANLPYWPYIELISDRDGAKVEST
jgi:hypothetical protein